MSDVRRRSLDGIDYEFRPRVVTTTGTGWVCMSCGVVVGDNLIHSNWHNDGAQ